MHVQSIWVWRTGTRSLDVPVQLKTWKIMYLIQRHCSWTSDEFWIFSLQIRISGNSECVSVLVNLKNMIYLIKKTRVPYINIHQGQRIAPNCKIEVLKCTRRWQSSERFLSGICTFLWPVRGTCLHWLWVHVETCLLASGVLGAQANDLQNCLLTQPAGS